MIPPRISNGEQELGVVVMPEFGMGLGRPIFKYRSPRWAYPPPFMKINRSPVEGENWTEYIRRMVILK